MELYLVLIALVAVQIRTRTPSRGVVPTSFVTRVSDLLKFPRAKVSCFCHCCGLRAAWQFQTFRNWVKSVARGMQTGIGTASTTAADRWSADTRTALNGGACQLDTAASLFFSLPALMVGDARQSIRLQRLWLRGNAPWVSAASYLEDGLMQQLRTRPSSADRSTICCSQNQECYVGCRMSSHEAIP